MLRIEPAQLDALGDVARARNERDVLAALDAAHDAGRILDVGPEGRAEAAARAAAFGPTLKLTRMGDYAALGALAVAVGAHWDSFLRHPAVLDAIDAGWMTGQERLNRLLGVARDALDPPARAPEREASA